MKKILLILVVVIGFGVFTNAQDVITLKNGTDIKVLVQKIGDVEVEYKKFDNPNGPNYTLKKSEILIIRYENGTKDIFSENTKLIDNDKISISTGNVFTINKNILIGIITFHKQTKKLGLKLQKAFLNRGFSVSHNNVVDGMLPKFTSNTFLIKVNNGISWFDIEIIDLNDQRLLFNKRYVWVANLQKDIVDKFINDISPYME